MLGWLGKTMQREYMCALFFPGNSIKYVVTTFPEK
jgi:hypothetical protein